MSLTWPGRTTMRPKWTFGSRFSLVDCSPPTSLILLFPIYRRLTVFIYGPFPNKRSAADFPVSFLLSRWSMWGNLYFPTDCGVYALILLCGLGVKLYSCYSVSNIIWGAFVLNMMVLLVHVRQQKLPSIGQTCDTARATCNEDDFQPKGRCFVVSYICFIICCCLCAMLHASTKMSFWARSQVFGGERHPSVFVCMCICIVFVYWYLYLPASMKMSMWAGRQVFGGEAHPSVFVYLFVFTFVLYLLYLYLLAKSCNAESIDEDEHVSRKAGVWGWGTSISSATPCYSYKPTYAPLMPRHHHTANTFGPIHPYVSIGTHLFLAIQCFGWQVHMTLQVVIHWFPRLKIPKVPLKSPTYSATSHWNIIRTSSHENTSIFPLAWSSRITQANSVSITCSKSVLTAL